jgi:hypothetical protein
VQNRARAQGKISKEALRAQLLSKGQIRDRSNEAKGAAGRKLGTCQNHATIDSFDQSRDQPRTLDFVLRLSGRSRQSNDFQRLVFRRLSLPPIGQELAQKVGRAEAGQAYPRRLSLTTVERLISDISGLSGLRIQDAILAGERDPRKLASLAHYRVQKNPAQIEAALTGDYPELLFEWSDQRQVKYFALFYATLASLFTHEGSFDIGRCDVDGCVRERRRELSGQRDRIGPGDPRIALRDR